MNNNKHKRKQTFNDATFEGKEIKKMKEKKSISRKY